MKLTRRDQPIKTFVDASVLINAWNGIPVRKPRAATVLADANRQFVSSNFVWLEVLPKALYNKSRTEQQVYEAFFKHVRIWADDLEQVVADAMQVAPLYGLAACDALHIAAALLARADEFVTSEKPTKPFSRVRGIKVTSIY